MTDPKTLVQHVLTSNAIERIFVGKGDPLYDRHLEAACGVERMAAAGLLSHPFDIHRMLLPAVATRRTTLVYVGDRAMPKPDAVRKLMADWTRAYRSAHAFVGKAPDQRDWNEWMTKTGDKLHDWYLCVHPSEDGNGRTARLVLNSFRRACGFPWQITRAPEVPAYYARIREFETNVFRKWYPPEIY